MIRYRVSAKAAHVPYKVTLALTDYQDVAQVLKETVERDHPEYTVTIQDMSSSPTLFNQKEDAFGSSD